MTDPSFTTTALVPSSSRRVVEQPTRASSLTGSARDLRDAARTFRQASDARHEPEDLARAFALVGAALDDLAAGAERVAYATMERSRRRRDGAPDGPPLATARALSWRLHGMRSEILAARRICSDATGVLDGALRR